MKQLQELVCGAKLKGVSGRSVHSLRRQNMRNGPVTYIRFQKGDVPGVQAGISEMLIEKGARDPSEVLVSAGFEDPRVEDDMNDGTFMTPV